MQLYKDIKEEDIYTWPDPHFPFKCLLDTKACRIFLLENISHNFLWLRRCAESIRETDFFFVTLGWFLSPHLANQGRYILDELGLNKDNFFVLYNSPLEEKNGLPFGLQGSVINHNAWIDEEALRPLSLEKKYNALYIARAAPFKRHYLARNIPHLALAAGGYTADKSNLALPPCNNTPGAFLTKGQIRELINESKCGLCLSAEEGACYSSSEYLLCGVPVVSTQSHGGRDVWYEDFNSILCEDTPEAVAAAVELANATDWDSYAIRKAHIAQATQYRHEFLVILQDVLNKLAPPLDAQEVFNNNFSWYCNEDSTCVPHTHIVEGYFN